jgi:glycosyltransferase involved in cell wall biosynthesis
MTDKPQNILLIHQGSELYGSDRSFLTTVEILRNYYSDAYIEVHLPNKGELGPLIESIVNKVVYDERGYLRKADFKEHGIGAIYNIFSTIGKYVKLSKNFDFVYINTIVCISAIVGVGIIRRKNSVVHVREISKGFFGLFFRTLLFLSSSRLIFNSKATQKAFSLAGQVVFNGVDPIYKDAEINESFQESAVKLLVIGRINSWKGQKFLIESLAETQKNLEIRIVGDVFKGCEHFKIELLEAIEKSKLKNVEVFGFTDDPGQHFKWCDFVVVPSTLPEPFGRVAIESMSVKRPVIAANHGGLVEIITHNKDGFLFNASNKHDLRQTIEVELNLTNQHYIDLCTKAYQTYLEKFSTDSYRKGLLNAIK